MNKLYLKYVMPCWCQSKPSTRSNLLIVISAFIVLPISLIVSFCYSDFSIERMLNDPKKYILPNCNDSNIISHDEYLILKDTYRYALQDRVSINILRKYDDSPNFENTIENALRNLENNITCFKDEINYQLELQKECIKSQLSSISLNQERKFYLALFFIIFTSLYTIRVLLLFTEEFWNEFVENILFCLPIVIFNGGWIIVVTQMYQLTSALQNMDEYMQKHGFNMVSF